MEIKQLNILLIGPKLDSRRNNIGGATLSFEVLIDYLNTQGIPNKVISTQQFKKEVINLVHVLLLFFFHVWKANVVFVNVSQSGVKHICPLIYCLSRLCNRKVVIRPFGGAMAAYYEKYSPWRKWLFRKTVLKSDIFYLQTQRLIEFFSEMSKTLKHLPTTRNPPDEALLRDNRTYQKKFVFIGHIKASKGVDEIIECINSMDDSYMIHLYGPIRDAKYKNLHLDYPDNYCGVLSLGEVLSTMRNYDVLLMPTYYDGEGYPGTIIEAYSIGLPVITTKWQAIPEIVSEGETGFLIEKESAEELKYAMESIEKQSYIEMSKKSIQFYRNKFDAEVVMSQLMKDIAGIV